MWIRILHLKTNDRIDRFDVCVCVFYEANYYEIYGKYLHLKTKTYAWMMKNERLLGEWTVSVRVFNSLMA